MAITIFPQDKRRDLSKLKGHYLVHKNDKTMDRKPFEQKIKKLFDATFVLN